MEKLSKTFKLTSNYKLQVFFSSEKNNNLVVTPQTLYEVRIKEFSNLLSPAKTAMEEYREKLEKIYQKLNEEEDPV